MIRLLNGLLALALLAGLAGLGLQWRERVRLGSELARLRREHHEANRLRRENRRVAELPSQPDFVARQTEVDADLARLRADAAALQGHLQMLTGAAPASAPPPPPARPLSAGMTPLDRLRNSGAGSPRDAAESFFWALGAVDPDALAKQLVIADEARAKADELFAWLDADSRERIGSPEKLLAVFFTARYGRVAGMQLDEPGEPAGAASHWNARVETVNGALKSIDFPVRQTAEGWREVVSPGDVRSCALYLGQKS